MYNKGKFQDLSNKHQLNELVFLKSMISDSRANELKQIGKFDCILPSAAAVIGDAIMDQILLTNAAVYFPRCKTKESLNELKKKYCSNDNWVYIMKKLEWDYRIDVGNNINSLENGVIATSFEALIYYVYSIEGTERLLKFLKEISFFNDCYENSSNDLDYYIDESINNAIKTLSLFSMEDNFVEITKFNEMYDIFEKTIKKFYEEEYGEKITDIVDAIRKIGTDYLINEIDGKCYSNYINKYEHKVKKVHLIWRNFNELNKKKQRLKIEDNTIKISSELFENIQQEYMIGFLKKLIDYNE